MANSSSDPSLRNRALQNFLDASGGGRGPTTWRQIDSKDDPWGDDDISSKAGKIDATSDQEHEEILRRLRQQEEGEGMKANLGGSAADEDEVERMMAENEELRSIIAELRQLLDESAGSAEQGSVAEKEQEYEAMLEEKTEQIRMLHVQIQELEKQVGSSGGGRKGAVKLPSKEEILALSDELDRERCQLEQERRQLENDRRQLQEDEEAMTRQMREMELQMAKERAELARQRNELTRLQSEIRHELERAQRDRDIHARLKDFRRSQEGEEGSPKKKSSGQIPTRGEKKKEDDGGGGLFGRWFGRK